MSPDKYFLTEKSESTQEELGSRGILCHLLTLPRDHPHSYVYAPGLHHAEKLQGKFLRPLAPPEGPRRAAANTEPAPARVLLLLSRPGVRSPQASRGVCVASWVPGQPPGRGPRTASGSKVGLSSRTGRSRAARLLLQVGRRPPKEPKSGRLGVTWDGMGWGESQLQEDGPNAAFLTTTAR